MSVYLEIILQFKETSSMSSLCMILNFSISPTLLFRLLYFTYWVEWRHFFISLLVSYEKTPFSSIAVCLRVRSLHFPFLSDLGTLHFHHFVGFGNLSFRCNLPFVLFSFLPLFLSFPHSVLFVMYVSVLLIFPPSFSFSPLFTCFISFFFFRIQNY
jgi:hypothetical protein